MGKWIFFQAYRDTNLSRDLAMTHSTFKRALGNFKFSSNMRLALSLPLNFSFLSPKSSPLLHFLSLSRPLKSANHSLGSSFGLNRIPSHIYDAICTSTFAPSAKIQKGIKGVPSELRGWKVRDKEKSDVYVCDWKKKKASAWFPVRLCVRKFRHHKWSFVWIYPIFFWISLKSRFHN